MTFMHTRMGATVIEETNYQVLTAGYEAADTNVIPLRSMDGMRLELERQLDAAIKAKDEAREELMALPHSTEVLLAASLYSARLAKVANLVNKLDGMGFSPKGAA